MAEAATVNELALAGMSEAERQQLLTLVARMIAALNRPRAEGPCGPAATRGRP